MGIAAVEDNEGTIDNLNFYTYELMTEGLQLWWSPSCKCRSLNQYSTLEAEIFLLINALLIEALKNQNKIFFLHGLDESSRLYL